jgi:hypothetical protein
MPGSLRFGAAAIRKGTLMSPPGLLVQDRGLLHKSALLVQSHVTF